MVVVAAVLVTVVVTVMMTEVVVVDVVVHPSCGRTCKTTRVIIDTRMHLVRYKQCVRDTCTEMCY